MVKTSDYLPKNFENTPTRNSGLSFTSHRKSSLSSPPNENLISPLFPV